MTAWLTIDGGASGSRARAVDCDGAAASARGAPLSLTGVELPELRRRIEGLLGELGEQPAGVRVSAGLAGVHPDSSTALASWLAERLATEHVTVGRDVDLLLAQLEGHGAALVVGTGAIAVGRGPAGEVVVDGRGFPAGDRGGGAWLGLEALRACLRERDREGVAPPLLDELLAALSPAHGDTDAARFAALAPVVLARAGEPIADQVIAGAVSEIASAVRAALERSGAPASAQVVAAGGLFEAAPFAEALENELGPAVRRVDPLDGRLT